MIARILFLFSLALLLLLIDSSTEPASAITCPASLNYGDTIDCSIGVSGETDSYSFSGTSGDRAIVRMVKTSGTLYPDVKILRPNGTTLCSTLGSPMAELNTCLLDTTGTHTVSAKDRYGTGTGNYNVHFQRTNSPSNALSISYSEVLAGTTSPASELDAFTFSGTSGERVVARLGKMSGTLYPKLWIYRPNGTLKCSVSGGTAAEVDTCLLDATGTHALIVGDLFGDKTGDYRVNIQRTNNPVGATALSYGQTISASIDTVEVDAFTFTVNAGERVFARMADNSSSLEPQIKIYRPDGSVVCSVGFASYGDSASNDCLADTSGTHTLLTRDYSGAEGGSYGLYVEHTTSPGNSISVSFDQTLAGSVSVVGEMDSFSFTGNGDRAFVKMVTTGGATAVDPWIRLYGPDGVVACCGDYSPTQQCNEGNYGYDVDFDCPAGTGSNQLLVGDFSGPYTGNYYVYLQRTKNPVGATSIGYGSIVAGSFTAGEMNPYTFSGRAGELAIASLDVGPDTNTSDIAIFNPDGTRRCRSANYGDTVTVQCTLTQSGTHTILVGEFNTANGGSYSLTLSGRPPVCDPAHPTCDSSFPNAYAAACANISSGDCFLTQTDIQIPGRGIPLSFTRYYHSGLTASRDLGYGWTHTYAMYLEFPPGGVKVFYADGHAVVFALLGGTYVPRAGVFETLAQNGDGTYTLTTPSRIRYNFSSAGKLTSIKDRNDNTTSLTYTGNLLTAVTDPGGRSLTFQYDASNRIWKITDPLPSPETRTVEFTYDANGDLTQVKDVKGGTTAYAYTGHRITSVTDSNNHVAVQNIYDSANRVVEQRDALNGVTCLKYGVSPIYTSAACPAVSPAPNGNQTVVVNARGNKTTFSYDDSFRPTEVKDALSGTRNYSYNTSHNVTCVTDERGKKQSGTYDSKGNLTQVIDSGNTDTNCQLKAGGVKWAYVYTSTNDIQFVTDPLGRQTEYVYDSLGNLTRIAGKDGYGVTKAVTCLERDTSGQPNGWGQITTNVQSTDPTAPNPCTGHRTVFGYDAYGNQTCAVNPRFASPGETCGQIATKTTTSYDPGGRLLSATDELRQAFGAAESGSQCGSAGTGNGIDDDADTVIDDGCPNAKDTYDAQNNVLTVTDALGSVSTNTYDAKGNLKTITDANRATVGAAESGGQCGGAGTGNGVDDDGDGLTDDGCPSSIYNYDNGDRLTSVIDALGQTTSYAYDANSNRTSVTSPKRQPVGTAESGTQCGTSGTGNDVDDDGDGVKDDGCPSIKYAFDPLDRRQSTTDALGRVTFYQYDAASNLTERTDARGLVTKYFPDDLNRLDLVEHWSGTTLVDSVDYTYNAVGFRTQMVDPTGTTTYTTDALDRLTSVTFPGPKTVSYTYDDLPGGSPADYPGQRTKVTYPDGKYVDYTYLADGSMSTVTDWLSKVTTYTYDNAGRLTKTQLPSTVWTDFTYDAAGRLASVVNRKPGPVTISSFTYTVDKVGNRTQMIDLTGTHNYQFDPLYRLTQVTYPGPTTDTYTYDAVGNRLTKNAAAYTYDAADQMTAAGGVAYGYDNNGNQTSRGSDTFTYDHENRLTQATIAGAAASSTYNGDGLRMSHTAGGATTYYTLDVAAGLPVVLQDGANTYVYGRDLISATDGAGTQTYFLYDGLGSTANLTDGSGNTTATYSYDVFGAIRSQDPPGGANPWLFTGEQRDADSDLYYLRARYYDPATGRFLGLDPVGQGNGYSYVANNPATFTDPTGLCILGLPCPKLPSVKLPRISPRVSKTALRMALSMTPVIGDANDLIAVITGYDIIWGEHISREERALYAAGLIFGSGSMYRKGLGAGADSAHLVSKGSMRDVIQRTSREHASRGRNYLKGFLSHRERAAYDLDPAGGSRFLGQAVHRATAQNVPFPYHTRGVDFPSPHQVELSTLNQLPSHTQRYGGDIGYATYILPTWD